MNEADTEIISGLLENFGYSSTNDPAIADIVLINSCSVREKAKQRAINKLKQYNSLKKKNKQVKIGLVGCVAQQHANEVQTQIPDIDILLGPDSYRNLTDILISDDKKAINNILSKTEMYDNLQSIPQNTYYGYIPIMRGCNNFCTYCIVPYTRGRERSLSFHNIVKHAKQLVASNRKELILLGQNVNSYSFQDKRFPDVLKAISEIEKIKRIRFTSPHPKDLDERTIQIIAQNTNICNHIHLPLQSGSSKILKAMNRTYTQSDYLHLVDLIKKHIPTIAITTDIITGFPGETDTDFQETLKIMEYVKYDNAFTFKYSPRPGTKAAEMPDTVSENTKSDRLNEMITLQKKHTLYRNNELKNTTQEVFIESNSKKNINHKIGRTETNKLVIIKKGTPKIGEFINVKIIDAAGVSLFGEIE